MQSSEYITLINEYLENFFSNVNTPYKGLSESMRYSLNAGGKRIRPILVLEFSRITGGDILNTLPIACAVEMIHTYSLIHDDLPCMDNDDYRRGKLTNHKVFGETTAILAGDALQAEAFRSVLSANIPDPNKVKCASILSEAIGVDGMCGGQYLDTVLEFDARDQTTLDFINNLKTGALLSASCRIGAAVTGSSEDMIESAGLYGKYLGIAFQIRDDVLDVIGTKSSLGKTIGSDENCNKFTYMSLLGEKKCMKLVEEFTERAKQALLPAFHETGYLFSLADSLIWRCS